MKAYCQYCQKDMKSKVREPIDKFHIGRIICPNCHTENKRYFSEFDVLLCFVAYSSYFVVGIILSYFIFDNIFSNNYILGILLFVLIFAIGYLYTDAIVKYIYINAPFKTTWKNRIIKDEVQIDISRRLNFHFIVIIGLSFAASMQDDLFYLYILAMIIIIAIDITVAFLCYKREKEQNAKQ